MPEETGWVRAWLELIEAGADPERVARGRRYARQDRVSGLRIEPGSIQAEVVGSRSTPYEVTVRCDLLEEMDTESVLDQTARALQKHRRQGRLSDVVAHMAASGEASTLGLVPSPQSHDSLTFCTCPDWVTRCKHVVAVGHRFAEDLRRDPLPLFRWRGIERSRVERGLQVRDAWQPPQTESALPVDAAEIARFWDGPQALPEPPADGASPPSEAVAPVIPALLGPPPAPDGDRIQQALVEDYRLIARRARGLPEGE